MKTMKSRSRWFPALMNIIGLGIAFSIFLILMSQVWYDFRYDRFEGGKDVYKVDVMYSYDEGVYSSSVLRPIIPMVKDSSPEIAFACDYTPLTNDQVGMVQILDKNGEEVTAFGIDYAWTESSVLDVFNITLTEGRREDFSKKGDALISESAAKFYFPDRNPIGEPFFLEFQHECHITGIYKDRKDNESMINGLLVHEGETDLSLPNFKPHSCYIKLVPGADIETVREAVRKVELRGETNSKLTQIHRYWFEKSDLLGTGTGGNRTLCLVLVTIASLFLGIAGFNYVNFSMASIPFRIRGINTRKVSGASRNSLIAAQLAEAFVIVGCAFILGLLTMKTLSGTEWATFLSCDMDPRNNVAVLCLGIGAAVILAFVSSIVPALYSTSFQPALVLKGSFALTSKGGALRTVTLLLQYVLSFIFILCALMLQRQTSYMINNDPGFDHEMVLKMESHSYTKVKDVAEQLRNIPGVVDVARGDAPMKENGRFSKGAIQEGEDFRLYDNVDISPEYAGFFGLETVEGRLPLPGESNVALVNESFLKEFPLYCVGKAIASPYGKDYTIIGILKDFHAMSLKNDYSPLVFFVNDDWNFASFMIRVQPDADVRDILGKARKIYAEKLHLEEDRIEAGLLDKDMEKLYEQEIRQTRLIRLSSLLSLIITLIGVLGLLWFDTCFMRKEIAIRKVNGATREDVLSRICRRYLFIAAAGFVVAVPVSVAICQRWLQHFAFRTNMPVWLFVLAFAAVLVITLAAAFTQTWLAASANPVDSIKDE